MTMPDRTDAMADELHTEFGDVVLSGGGASSRLMMQIFADVFDRPTSRIAGDSAAGRGAAICAAVAAGVHRDVGSAVNAMVTVRDTFAPEAGRVELYDQLRTVHRDIANHTDPIHRRLAEIVG